MQIIIRSVDASFIKMDGFIDSDNIIVYDAVIDFAEIGKWVRWSIKKNIYNECYKAGHIQFLLAYDIVGMRSFLFGQNCSALSA